VLQKKKKKKDYIHVHVVPCAQNKTSGIHSSFLVKDKKRGIIRFYGRKIDQESSGPKGHTSRYREQTPKGSFFPFPNPSPTTAHQKNKK
jgi:hypothetical protein